MGVLTQTPTTSTGGTSTVPIMPDYLAQAQQTIAGQGAALAGQDYQTYQGPRVAGFTPDQLAAQQMTQNAAAGTQVDPTQMQGAINYGLSPFDPNQIAQYMSPYTSAVVNEIGRLGQQNLTQNVMPSVNSTFTGAGQFGSTRNADFLNRGIAENNYATLGQQSQALQQGYTGALNAYTNWHNQALPNAAAANNLQNTNAQNLGVSGALQQGQGQTNLNTAYQDFLNQTQYPQQQLNWYANLTNQQNMPVASSQTNTSTAYAPSGLQTAAGVYGLMSGIKPLGQ